MDILVLGGTVFLSRTVAETALAARPHGHHVQPRPSAARRSKASGRSTGDRTDARVLRQLPAASFDLVFDTGYYPDRVRAGRRMLEPTVGALRVHLVDQRLPRLAGAAGLPRRRHLRRRPGRRSASRCRTALPENGAYGWRKVGAERAVLRSLRRAPDVHPAGRADRRPARRGRPAALVAGPDLPRRRGAGTRRRRRTQLRMIDARDIAEFALLRPAGTFEVTGPARQITRRQLFEEAREVTGSDARFRLGGRDYLARAGVEAGPKCRCGFRPPRHPGLFAHDTTAAEAAGLACRPVPDTLARHLASGCSTARAAGNPRSGRRAWPRTGRQELLAGWRGRRFSQPQRPAPGSRPPRGPGRAAVPAASRCSSMIG